MKRVATVILTGLLVVLAGTAHAQYQRAYPYGPPALPPPGNNYRSNFPPPQDYPPPGSMIPNQRPWTPQYQQQIPMQPPPNAGMNGLVPATTNENFGVEN